MKGARRVAPPDGAHAQEEDPMTFATLRRSLAATAVLTAIAVPSAMACGGNYNPPPTGQPGTPCAKTGTYGSYGGHYFRGRGGRHCRPTTPPPVTPPPVTPPVDPPPSL
jgi:hypothetical protein